MNKEVNFEIAKLLKEKGFDRWSANWYSVEGICYKENEFDNCRGYIPTKDCNAPTIAEVVMWLYEKHGIWIDVSLNQFSKPKDLQWMYSIVFTQDCTYSHSPKSYSSPTEAYEAAIKYTLENIK